MKKIHIDHRILEETHNALDEVENAVLGRTHSLRTGISAGAPAACKTWLCPQPLYGVPV